MIQNVARRHDVAGRAIIVLDDLFDGSFIRIMYHFFNRLRFGLSDYDSEETKSVLHWKHEFDLTEPPVMPLLQEFIKRICQTSMDSYPSSELHLERMHCNMHLYGDVQHAHTDLVPGVTTLYFANPEWKTEWMGETVFCGDDGEPLYAILPKPGRLVIFDGSIVHRAGVPSRYCLQPRVSIAFKFLSNGGMR